MNYQKSDEFSVNKGAGLPHEGKNVKLPVSDNLVIDEKTLPVISQLAESIPGGFFIYHADGNQELIYFNSRLSAIFGCESKEEFRELVGNSFKGIVHPDDYAELENDILNQIKESTASSDHVRYRFVRKDGRIGMMEDYGHFSHSETFGDIYYVFVQDITEQYREEQERKENVTRMMALEDDFVSLYDVDLESGSYVNYVGVYLLSEKQIDGMVNEGDFFADLIENAKRVIYQDDREDFVKMLSRESIREALEKKSFFDWYYRLYSENGIHWSRLRVAYKDKEKTHIIIGIFNADREMEEKQREKQKREALIADISGSESTYILNPQNGSYVVVGRNEYLRKNYPVDETYTQAITRYLEKDVFEYDRESLRDALRLDNLMRRLENGNEYVIRYRDISTGKPRWYEMHAVRLSDSEVLFGFSDKNDEIIRQFLLDKLKDNYFALYYVNIDGEEGHAQVVKTMYPKLAGEKGEIIPYTPLIRRIAAASQGETAELLNRISDIGFVKEYFAANETAYYTYKSFIIEGNRWVQVTGLALGRQADGTLSSFVLAFSLLDEKASEQEEVKRNLQKATEKLNAETKRKDILLDVIHSGKWSVYVNAADEVTGADISDEAYNIVNNNEPRDGRAWQNNVHPDDKKFVTEAFAAAICDHSCKTPYDVNFRMYNRSGKYLWVHAAGRMIRGEDGNGELFGILVDITEQMEAQQERLLGAMPLSSDILTKANIGLWAFELDEGQAPRMYVDEAMLGLIGLTEQVSPEETYHAWYDHIDAGSYGLVAESVEKMTAGEHAEVQYPWHHPNGHTMIVRCGGVRNYEYTKGIRIEGTHQDVTETLHFDEKVARHQEAEYRAAQLRAEMLGFISDHEPDTDEFLHYFGKRVLDITGCDRFDFLHTDGHRIVVNAEGIGDTPQADCAESDGTGTYSEGKSSYVQEVYCDDKPAGRLTVRYLNEYHAFTENDMDVLREVKTHLGLLLMRIASRKAELEKLRAESASAAKTQFLFNMSHDIRTPMNAILGYTDIGLRHTEDAERTRENYNKIKVAGGHLLNLINDILEMSRIESGTMELAEKPMDIRQSIAGITQMGDSLAIPKSIDFKTELAEVQNPYICADELHFSEVIINLVSNAIKYTPAGGKVRFRAEQIGGVTDGKVTYRFEVSDNGIGMSEEFQKHLFETFYREESVVAAKIEGTGLGLSIVKNIIDLAGGSIRVRSTLGEGSVFTAELSFRVMDAEAIEKFTAENAPREECAEVCELEGKKVLLVEDNEMNREIATEILSEAGMITDEAEDGEIAVKTVISRGTRYYDAILMDIQMPVMNGYEATKAIRALPDGDCVPIIALSANAFEEDKKESMENGMNAHIAKPIDVRTLFETLRGLLK